MKKNMGAADKSIRILVAAIIGVLYYMGTISGTYLANFIFKSSEVIDEKSDSLEDIVHDTIEKGKEFMTGT